MHSEVGYPSGLNQNWWLSGVIDREITTGICMALVYEWAITYQRGGDPSHLLSALLDQSGPDWQRRISFQRAYDGMWMDHSRQMQYPAWHALFENATTRFLAQNGQRDGVTITRIIDTPNAMNFKQALLGLAANDIYIVVFDGDGNNRNPGAGIWGHVVGLAYRSQPISLRPHYFDPNTGFFYLDNAVTAGAEVVDNLYNLYHGIANLNIRGYMLYRCT